MIARQAGVRVGSGDAQFREAAREALQVLVEQQRPPAVDRDHLVHGVGEEEAAVERRDARGLYREEFPVEIGDGQRRAP